MNPKDTRLSEAPLCKLIISMAIPSIAAQLVNVLYSIIDRIYIGHIKNTGALALTGVGICFPIILLISAFSVFAGAGGAPLAAIALGRGDRDKAERYLGNAAFLLLVFSTILTISFMILKKPVLYAFGGSENTIEYASAYLNVYLIGTLFVQLSLGLNMFIICQGRSLTAMLSVFIGALINIALDPLFIFVFKMGVQGAALATVISQACSCIWIIRFLTTTGSSIKLKLIYLRPDKNIILSIASLGISSFIMQATECLINITFNKELLRYGGDFYVGSMAVIQSVMQLVIVPVQGFNQGIQPIISYNFGAGNKERIKKTFIIILIASVFITTQATLITRFFPRQLAGIFSDKRELIDIATEMMPLFMSGIWIFGVQMACQTAFVALGETKISLFLALLRKVLLLVPLAVILPHFIGVRGVYLSEPISDMTSATVAGIMFITNIKRILNKET